MDAAAHLIAAQGLARTTVDQIAERADIAQTTFFNHFPSKADLGDALVERLIGRLCEFPGPGVADGSTVAERIGVLFRTSAELTDDQLRVLGDIVAEAVRAPVVGRESSLDRLRGLFAVDLASGQGRGEVRADRSPAALADAVLGIYVSALLFRGDEDDPVGERLRGSAELAADLIGTRATDAVPSP